MEIPGGSDHQLFVSSNDASDQVQRIEQQPPPIAVSDLFQPPKDFALLPKSRVERSPVWRFFQVFNPPDPDNKNCRCIVQILDSNGVTRPCNFKMRFTTASYGTSNLFRHLRNHPEQLQYAKAASSRCALNRLSKRDSESLHGVRGTKSIHELLKYSTETWQRRYILWCILDFISFTEDPGSGFSLFMGGIFNAYPPKNMSYDDSKGLLFKEYDNVKRGCISDLNSQYRQIGKLGPFCSLQMNNTSISEMVHLITLTATFVDQNFFLRRITLGASFVTKTASKVEVMQFIMERVHVFFDSFMPSGYELKDIFVAGTAKAGSIEFESIVDSGIPAIPCVLHELNLCILKSLDSADANEELRYCFNRVSCAIQTLKQTMASMNEDTLQVQNILRDSIPSPSNSNFNEPYWMECYSNMSKLLDIRNIENTQGFVRSGSLMMLTMQQDWDFIRQIVGVLDPCKEIEEILILGEDCSFGRIQFLMTEMTSILCEENQQIRTDRADLSMHEEATIKSDLGPYRLSTVHVNDLSSCVQTLVKAMRLGLESMRARNPLMSIQRLSMILDPRLKDKLGYSSMAEAEAARADLFTAYNAALMPCGKSDSVVPFSGWPSSAEQKPKRRRISIFEKRSAERRASAQAACLAPGYLLSTEYNEVEVYLSQGLAPDFDPKFKMDRYWKGSNSEFPLLAQLSRKYLSVEAAACESFKEFSHKIPNLAKLRCLVGDELTQMMIFVKMNKHYIIDHLSFHQEKLKVPSQIVKATAMPNFNMAPSSNLDSVASV